MNFASVQLDFKILYPHPNPQVAKTHWQEKWHHIYNYMYSNLHCFIILTKRTGIIVTLACPSKAEPVPIAWYFFEMGY